MSKALDYLRSLSSLMTKTSNPFYTEGKDTQGNMPTFPSTQGIFDKEPQGEKESEEDTTYGQKDSGIPKKLNNNVTDPGTQYMQGLNNMTVYFDQPGDWASP